MPCEAACSIQSDRIANSAPQISLPASVRDPGVWFVLAGFVKVAALTMSMGTSPFGERHENPAGGHIKLCPHTT